MLWDAFAHGAFDQSELELREDILVYTSQPLTEGLTVIGNPHLTFWAKSTAKDTDFTAKLIDVHPGGFAQNIVDSIVGARYRNGAVKNPSLIQPGKTYEYTIDLGPTAIVFKEGHRIRIEIASSNFPRFDRNTNTGTTIAFDNTIEIATQYIFHDKSHNC